MMTNLNSSVARCLAAAVLSCAVGWALGADVTVDGGVTRTVSASDRVTAGRYVVGAAQGVGKVSTLAVTEGAQLLGQYSSLSLGTVAGATGVVSLVGGALPAIASKSDVSNMSYVYAGVSGAGFFTNDHGQVYLRECFQLGVKSGAYGRYVHKDGEFGFCFGGKPFAVGVLGCGEADVVAGTLNLQDLLIGGTNNVDNVVTVRTGGTVRATERISVGGYTNRMNRTCLEYPYGRGRIDLRGGTLSLASTTATAASPILTVGPYATSSGEIRGWGSVASPTTVNRAYVGFGHGRIVADGFGEERVLDFSVVAGTTNLFGAADCGWAATNGGALWLPRGRVSVSYNGTATCRLGATEGRTYPDVPGSVMVRVSVGAAATHTFCGGPYALDRSDAHVTGLPDSLGTVGLWKLGDATTAVDWQANVQDFKTAVVTFAYDPGKVRRADSNLMLLRREDGAWKRLTNVPQNDTHTVVSPSVKCLTGETFNLGEFAILEVEAFHGNVSGELKPGADGWTEIGNLGYLTNAVDGATVTDGYASSMWYENMACPDWRNITLSEPKRVRFVGGVLLADELPAAVAYDFTRVASLVTVTNRVFADGSPIRVPKGAYYRFLPALIEEDPATGRLSRTLDTRTGMNRLQDDLELNGTAYVNDSTGSLAFDGRLTGGGLIRMFNYYKTLVLCGEVDYDGEIMLGQVQNDVTVSPRSTPDAHLGTVRICGTPKEYRATYLTWTPPKAGGALTIDSVIASGNSGWLAASSRRFGNAIRVCADGAVRIGTLNTDGSGTTRGLHLIAAACTNAVAVTVDEIAKASRLYLGPDVDLTVGTVKAASVFDCTALGTTVNLRTLTYAGPHSADCRLVADTPSQLPAAVNGYTGQVEIASSAYDVPADPTRTYVIPKGTQMPATGAITVVLPGELPAAGRYAIMTWPTDSPLADAAAWSVTLKGRAELCALERTADGLTLVVPETDGVAYHVDSETGDDAANGLTPETAWRTLAKVNAADILPGERVLFRRGGLWRGQLLPKSGRLGAPVVYGAYGTGEKPILQYSDAAEAPGSWTKAGAGVWRTVKAYPISVYRDIGNVIFNHGEAYGWKRWALDKLVNDRDYWYDRDKGHVYLKSRYDPSTRWQSIELAIDQHVISEGNRSYVTYDGLAIRYGAAHGIGGGTVAGITVKHCDISWIGGGVLSTTTADDGTVTYTRYGNGIEFWGASRDCLVVSNRLWEIYDAAMTDQSDVGDHTNVVWAWNTVWNAEYSYEHFNRSKDYRVSDVTVEHNTFVDSGGAWAHEQRPDRNGAPLMIWYSSGPVTNFTIRNNVFSGTTEQGVRQTTDWHKSVSFSNNLFYTEGAPVVRLVNKMLDFQGFKDLGWDVGSVYGDPLFADPATHDYRLLPGSPGLGLASDGLPAGAYAEPANRLLTYTPSSDAAARNSFGRYVYSSANWTDSDGNAAQPTRGDVLVIGTGTSMTADPSAAAAPVDGLWYQSSSQANQGNFYLQAGGLGITNSTANASLVWYCTPCLCGTGDLPVYLEKGTALVLQRHPEQADGGAATLVKRGAGTLSVEDGSHHSTSTAATWKATRLEAGEFRWNETGAGGKAYDIQTFPVGHTLTFADDGTSDAGAVFSLGKRDCTWRDVDLRETQQGRRRHVVTSATTTNVVIRFTGTPRSNPLMFTAAFANRAGLWWNPDAAQELRLSRSVSLTKGDVRVTRGTVRLVDGATFRSLDTVRVASGATFAADAGTGGGFHAENLAMEAGGRLSVAKGVTLAFRRVTYDGAEVAASELGADDCDWIEGAGRVVIGAAGGERVEWEVAADTTESVTNADAFAAATRLVKTGAGTLRLEGAQTFAADMTVSNGTVTACGDESLGDWRGTTTFEIISKTQKGVLNVVCATGSNEVTFHRPVTFHYGDDGEWGDFMTLPENATVNFHGLMQTSIAAPHQGPGYPNHWRYSCPTTCTVHWYGGMKASLNHTFPGGTHYVHKALTGGDRLSVYNGARVYLLARGNSIGRSTGGLTGGAVLSAAVPYALDATADGKEQTLVISGEATLDLCGCDQALSVLSSNSSEGAKGVITSFSDAVLHIRGAYTLSADNGNGGYAATVTNRVRFAGRAGLSMERDAAKGSPLVLTSVSASSGELRAMSNRLVLAKGCAWPNCSKATVAGGVLELEASDALGEGVTVSIARDANGTGRLQLDAGVVQRAARLLVDGEPVRPGTYGSTQSEAAHRDDTLFAGPGQLRVGTPTGMAVVVK